MRISVHVERVVLDGVGAVPREALEAAIADAIHDRLSPPQRPPVRDPGVPAQVGLAVARHAGLGGPR